MKKKLVAAMALAMTVILAGCGGAGAGEGSQGEISGSKITESKAGNNGAGSENASASGSEDGGAGQGSESNAGDPAGSSADGSEKESSQPDGMVSAGSKEDMGIDESWKPVYADFLKNDLDSIIGSNEEDWRDTWSFGFIYLNNDPTPELVISSGYEAAGNIICSPVNGKVEYVQTSRLNFFYKEFGGILDNSDGNMGYYHDYIYKLDDKGFDLLHEGYNYDEYDNDGNISESHYEMDGKAITKEVYDKTILDLMPVMQRLYWAKGCSYADMIRYLEGNGAEDYKAAYREVIKDGIKGTNGELDKFALIERTNYEPLLLCANDREYCFCAFDDGLLQVGPTTYFSETALVLVYPGLGLIENNQYYENNEMYNARYYMKAGSVIYNYMSTEAKYDSDWEPILDSDGAPIITYKVNSAEVTKEQFNTQLTRYDEIFKQQLISPKEKDAIIEYGNAIQMYDKLGE